MSELARINYPASGLFGLNEAGSTRQGKAGRLFHLQSAGCSREIGASCFGARSLID